MQILFFSEKNLGEFLLLPTAEFSRPKELANLDVTKYSQNIPESITAARSFGDPQSTLSQQDHIYRTCSSLFFGIKRMNHNNRSENLLHRTSGVGDTSVITAGDNHAPVKISRILGVFHLAL